MIPLRWFSWFPLVLSLCTGCAGSMRGEVDGDRPPILRSGFWYYAIDDDDTVAVRVFLSSATSACKTQSQVMEDQLDAWEDFLNDEDLDDLADALEQIDEEYLPEEEWAVAITLWADDEDELVDSFDVDSGDDAQVSICHRDEYTDWDDVFEGRDADIECFYGDGGDVHVTWFEDERTIKGNGAVELEDEDGDNADEVAFSFSVRYCEDFQDAYDDALDEGWF